MDGTAGKPTCSVSMTGSSPRRIRNTSHPFGFSSWLSARERTDRSGRYRRNRRRGCRQIEPWRFGIRAPGTDALRTSDLEPVQTEAMPGAEGNHARRAAIAGFTHGERKTPPGPGFAHNGMDTIRSRFLRSHLPGLKGRSIPDKKVMKRKTTLARPDCHKDHGCTSAPRLSNPLPLRHSPTGSFSDSFALWYRLTSSDIFSLAVGSQSHFLRQAQSVLFISLFLFLELSEPFQDFLLVLPTPSPLAWHGASPYALPHHSVSRISKPSPGFRHVLFAPSPWTSALPRVARAPLPGALRYSYMESAIWDPPRSLPPFPLRARPVELREARFVASSMPQVLHPNQKQR